MKSKLVEPKPARPWWRYLTDALEGKARTFVGGPMVLLGCSAMVLWWGFVQHSRGLDYLLERTTARAEGRLVERYYLVLPQATGLEPPTVGNSAEMRSVAIFEFQDEAGRLHRPVFWDYAHDWQHNADFELGIPLLEAPVFKVADGVGGDRRAEVVDNLRQAIDHPGHWWLRLRQQPLAWRMPLRYDPQSPEVVLLESGDFTRSRASIHEYFSGLTIGLLLLIGTFTYLLLMPGLQLLIPGIKPWQIWALSGLIFVTVPLWGPYGLKLAPVLSDESGKMAEFLKEEFGNDYHLGFVATPLPEHRVAEEVLWRFEESRYAAALAPLGLELPAPVGPLDFDGAFTHLRQQFVERLPDQNEDRMLAMLQGLRGLDQETTELLAPALYLIATLYRPPAEGSPESDVFAAAYSIAESYAAHADRLDVDDFLYDRRLKVWRDLAQIEGLRETAVRREQEARDYISKQKATM